MTSSDEAALSLPAPFHLALEMLDEGDVQRGIGLLRDALEECRGGDPEAVALCTAVLAEAYEEAGRDNDALQAFRAAVELYRDCRNLEQFAICSMEAGRLLLASGDVEESARLLDEARWHLVDVADVALCLNMLGVAWCRSDRDAEAAEVLQEAVRLFESLEESGRAAVCRVDSAAALLALGRTWDAEAALRTARQEFAGLGDHESVVGCEIDLLHLHRVREDVPAILLSLETTASALRVVGDDELAAAFDVERARHLGDLGEFDRADTLYRAARDYFATNDLALEVAECDVYRAGTLLDAGRLDTAETLLESASRVFDKEGHVDAMPVYHRLVGALHRARGRFGQAVDAFRAAIRIGQTAEDSGEFVADCRSELGATHTLAGEYVEAQRELDVADRYYRESGPVVKRAAVLQSLGIGQYRTGGYARAAELFDEAHSIYATYGDTYRYQMGVLDSHRAVVYMMLQQWAAAETATLAARAICETAGIAHQVSICDANLGCIYFGMKDYPRAETQLRRAATALAEMYDEGAAQCLQNLAAVYILTGRYAEAEAEFAAAQAVYGDRPEFAWQNAISTTNQGMLAVSSRRYDEALHYLRSARRMFAVQDALPQVARCDFLVAAAELEQSRGTGSPDYARALERGLPPLLFIDAQRFSFASARDRAGWAETTRVFMAAVFEWATEAGNTALLADLVESIVNSGIHSSERDLDRDSNSDAETGIAGMTRAVLDASIVEGIRPIDGSEGSRGPDADSGPARILSPAGSAALIDPRLPLLPPPRLRMPDGHIALGPQLDAAESAYGAVRRDGVVAVR
ncbi:tetratricopeptide repeat protein [Rhodococcus sp. 5G237]